MPLDPQARALLDQFEEQGLPPLEQMTVAEAREMIAGFKDLMGPPGEVATVEDRTIPGPGGALGIRVFRPLGEPPFPVLMYFHGGGWVTASVAVADTPCRTLANVTGAVVVAVEYRLAPEHTCPAALHDCYAATRWAAEHAAELGGDPDRLVVLGDSAGGNLATAVALKARDLGGPRIAYQVLIYPVTDCRFDTASYAAFAEGHLLTREGMRWFWARYLNSEDEGRDPYVSPLRMADLSGLPPALIVTAEYDPLRDEGEAYGERLRLARVPVRISRYAGMIHGFFWMDGVLDRSKQLFQEIGTEVRSALRPRALA
jgi:acetyl esterase